MKAIGVLSFIIVFFGITFSIYSPYVHIGFLEGPVEPQKSKVEKKPKRRISRQNTNSSQVIDQTRQISRQRTSSPQTPYLSLDQLMANLRSSKDDFYKLEFIHTAIGSLRYNLLGAELIGILALFDHDSYRVDATSELQSRLRYNLSGAELIGILALFDRDSYRADATSELQSRLNPNYSDSDYRRFSELFTDDFYRTQAANSLVGK